MTSKKGTPLLIQTGIKFPMIKTTHSLNKFIKFKFCNRFLLFQKFYQLLYLKKSSPQVKIA